MDEAVESPTEQPIGVRGLARAVALLRAATIAGTAALAVNVAIFLAAQAAGAGFRVSQPNTSVIMTVGLVQVVVETLVAVVFGTLLLWPMTYLRAGLLVWLILAVIVGLGSTLIPLTRGQDTTTKLALASMHVITLAATLLFPARTARAIGAE